MKLSVKSWLIILSLLIAFFVTVILFYRIYTTLYSSPSYHLGETILVNRNPDWKNSSGFFTAAVLVKKNETGYNVRCKVYIGNDNYFEIFPLGSVQTIRQAYRKWGEIEWTDKELVIGTSAVTPVIIKRSQIENQR